MQNGKRKSWAAWTLLVVTSIPIHFLANSLTGPSYIFEPPQNVEYSVQSHNDTEYTLSYLQGSKPIYERNSFLCWSAFKTGRAHIPKSRQLLSQESADALGNPVSGSSFTKLTVTYSPENCTGLVNTTSDVITLELGYVSKFVDADEIILEEGNCSATKSVRCMLSDEVPAKCRLNVRLNAAFVLMVALTIKAIYMIAVNVTARGHLKRQLLTYGDVLVASAAHPELRIQGYVFTRQNSSEDPHSVLLGTTACNLTTCF
jgi:hypothetical protein